MIWNEQSGETKKLTKTQKFRRRNERQKMWNFLVKPICQRLIHTQSFKVVHEVDRQNRTATNREEEKGT